MSLMSNKCHKCPSCSGPSLLGSLSLTHGWGARQAPLVTVELSLSLSQVGGKAVPLVTAGLSLSQMGSKAGLLVTAGISLNL